MKFNLNYKKIVIILLAFSLLIFNVPVYADTTDSYKVVMSTDKVTVNKGEEITITISLKDINIESGDKGIGSYTANLEFDSSVLEYVTSTGTDKWEAPMYSDGQMLGETKDGSVMKTDGSIGTITFKVKENTSVSEATISIKNFSGSNAVKDIKVADYSIKITIKSNSSGTIGDNSQGGSQGANGSTNSSNTVNSTNGNKNSNKLPQTGKNDINIYLIIGIIIFSVIAIRFRIKLKKLKK